MQDPEAGKQVQALVAENTRLKRAVGELSVLNEIATALNSSQSLEDIIRMMVQKCVRHLHVEQAVVMMLDQLDKVDPLQTMMRHADTSAAILPLRLDAELTGWMIKYRQPLRVDNLKEDPRFGRLMLPDTPVRSLICVPLLAKGEMIGTLTVFNKKGGSFTDEDQRLLSIIGAQSAQVIVNAQLLEEQKALVRVREEMRLAQNIQVNLLPKTQPQLAGYDIAGRSIPAKEVGGDYFDFIPLGDGKLAICLGDGTGKGMPAALLMANMQATIRAQALTEQPVKTAVRIANRLMHSSTDLEKFFTLFYGILDTRNHQFTYCNAGQDPPIWTHRDDHTRLETGGVVLGFLEDYPYQQATITLAPGDRLILFSDGIPEAMNVDSVEYGEGNLMRQIDMHDRVSATMFIDMLLADVNRHVVNHPQSDDMTVVVIKKETLS